MADSETGPTFERDALVSAVEQHLFADPLLRVFTVLDGAAIPDLLPKLEELAPENRCLYRGELEADLAQCAPYLVYLKAGHAFTRWVLTEGWGNNWGIFAVTSVDLDTLRRHFRTFLMVRSPEGKKLYFRYYDPRVLRVYLPTCNGQETVTVFGPIQSYMLADEDPTKLLRFSPDQDSPRRETIGLVQV